MGANSFCTEIIPIIDPAKAFASARDEASYDSGHSGYSGTIAEKDGFTRCSSEVLSPSAAGRLINRMLASEDSPVNDKWGPAGAIPVTTETRVETLVIPVTTSSLHAKLTKRQPPEFYLELATTHLKLARGETIVSARFSSSSLTFKKSELCLNVTVRKASAGRRSARTLSVTVPGGRRQADWFDLVERAVLAKLNLKNGADLDEYRVVSSVRKTKATTTRGTGRATRYVVAGDHAHENFATGFATLALATKHLRELSATPDAQDRYEVVGVVRSADGSPLVATEVTTVSTTLCVEAQVVTGRRPGPIDGWIFFGYASS